MIQFIKLSALLVLTYSPAIAIAGEGMWLPILVEKLNFDHMQKSGFKLSPEDIYSVNHSSMKDAVIIFDGRCTGGLISADGLILTNHHCVFSHIRGHSDKSNNYVEDGFWAMSREEELPFPGLSVSFLVSMEDVSDVILRNVDGARSEMERDSIISLAIDNLENEIDLSNGYESIIESFYYGEEYYLFIYKKYNDIRLVGIPPYDIGKFGGDTDNWMWPRHNGDFALLRIYADEENNPAHYSPFNQPYKSNYYFPLSTRGVSEGDFTMILGFPGTTEQYLTSHAVKYLQQHSLPHKINIREARLNVLSETMKVENEKLRYLAEYASTSNTLKKWQGMLAGMEKLNVVEQKLEFEQKFGSWASSDDTLSLKYASILNAFEYIYKDNSHLFLADESIREILNGAELLSFVTRYIFLENLKEVSTGSSYFERVIEYLINYAEDFFISYNASLDKEFLAQALNLFWLEVNPGFHPSVFYQVQQQYKGDFIKYMNNLFDNSLFTDKNRLVDFLDGFSPKDLKKLFNDPAYQLTNELRDVYFNKISGPVLKTSLRMDSLYRIYIRGLKEFQPDRMFYPDANFTLRMSYGKVEGYRPADAIQYSYYTTTEGILEKNFLELDDYNLKPSTHDFFEKHDFSEYGLSDGSMPVCFIASNHTSGGNSGSPVINGDGQLIGVNFDRNWEGTINDLYFNDEMGRNITVDIRYILFIVDKFAGAGYLLDEMEIVQ